jgi:hypothetical protein
VEVVPVVHGEMVAQVQVRRVVHKIQAQVSHQIFQAHRWNMAVAVMEIMVVRQELPELVQEVMVLQQLIIVAAVDHRCHPLETTVEQVALAL